MSAELHLEYYLQERFTKNAEAVLGRPVPYVEVEDAVARRIKSFKQMHQDAEKRLQELITDLRREMAAPYN